MKLFTKEEMKRLEAAAQSAGVSMAQLMEGAGQALAEEVLCRVRPAEGKRAVLLCGGGNNGGDGFVCADILCGQGFICSVILTDGKPRTDLALNAFNGMDPGIECIDGAESFESAKKRIDCADVIVDCIFGFSFRGEITGTAAELINISYRRDCLKISADIPSGVECDTGRTSLVTFKADVTVTFTAPKVGCCTFPGREYCGELSVRSVGIPAAILDGTETRCFMTENEFVGEALPVFDGQCNKGTRGRLLLVCGSYGMAGACIMAAKAALRSGVGLLDIALDRSIYEIVASAVPEAVFTVLDWENSPQRSRELLCAALEKCTACLAGCGLGTLADTVCPTVFTHCAVPLIADADALNFCARHSGVLEDVEAPMILTPHPGEMARLCGDDVQGIQADRLTAAKMKAREVNTVVVLKGAGTVTASPDGRCAVERTVNAGMAKGGSGDVLAGVIASLTAQGMQCFEAAAAGVRIHGAAGDICARRLGTRSMLPTDIIDVLPEVFKTLG